MTAELAQQHADGSGEVWLDRDGRKLACREKLKLLAENEAELQIVMHDAFEDAILMGVDEAGLRARLHALVDRLASPLVR